MTNLSATKASLIAEQAMADARKAYPRVRTLGELIDQMEGLGW